MISLLIGLLGVGMVFYSIIVLRRMWRMPHYQSTLEDWSWYLVLPLLANIALIMAALMLPDNPSLALYTIGAAMLLLLLVGIRNAWDNVTFLAVKRGAHTHPETENKSREKRRGDPSHRENRTHK